MELQRKWVVLLARLATNCSGLRSYIENNEDALLDVGPRHRTAKPISTSHAKGIVNQRVSARTNHRQQMRWLT